jgi:molecular chaperone GrpE (heat shock protein)
MQGGCIAINILEHARELEREVEDFARQLELELAVSLENQCKAQAEVERLKKELAAWDYGTRAEREQKRAEKAEAEVERLRKQLTRAVSMIVDTQWVERLTNQQIPA